ncbi:MAG: SAM-dependent chlorinase/fluorinase [bacterium]
MDIVLLTDFGTKDPYAGVLKGVIAQLAPEARVIDLTHEIPPFDVTAGALALFQSYRYFPKGTIFLSVVDPGVGSERRPILIQTKNYFFVGPDNGLFTLAFSGEKPEKIIHLTEEKYFLPSVSATFQGRDLFAPVAAYLSRGEAPERFGYSLEDYTRLEGLIPEVKKGEIIGKVLHVDRFGNALTNFSKGFLKRHFPSLEFFLTVKKKKITPLKTHYAEGEGKKPFLLFGSSNLLEISVNQGSAAQALKIERGDAVSVKGATSSPRRGR